MSYEALNGRQREIVLCPQLRSEWNDVLTSEVILPAPLSGTVISRSVNPGEVITADKELLCVSNLSSVWVIAQVYEKDLGKIRIGSGATITSDAYPGTVFRGQVSYIDPVIDQTTRNRSG